jgi:hypothetical protein
MCQELGLTRMFREVRTRFCVSELSKTIVDSVHVFSLRERITFPPFLFLFLCSLCIVRVLYYQLTLWNRKLIYISLRNLMCASKKIHDASITKMNYYRHYLFCIWGQNTQPPIVIVGQIVTDINLFVVLLWWNRRWSLWCSVAGWKKRARLDIFD